MHGMRVGAGHKWNYHTDKWIEKKISPREWKFTYYQVKHRAGKSAPMGSGMPIGARLRWTGTFTQHAIKTGPDTYKLVMQGTKYLGGFKTKRRQNRWTAYKKYNWEKRH